jgi:hypothetical protein
VALGVANGEIVKEGKGYTSRKTSQPIKPKKLPESWRIGEVLCLYIWQYQIRNGKSVLEYVAKVYADTNIKPNRVELSQNPGTRHGTRSSMLMIYL